MGYNSEKDDDDERENDEDEKVKGNRNDVVSVLYLFICPLNLTHFSLSRRQLELFGWVH